jgi:hypothetical protein
MGSRHGAAFQELGAILFKFFNTCLQIIHLKAEMIERTLLGADNGVDRIPTLVRAEMEELNEGITYGKKPYFHTIRLFFNDLATGKPKFFKFLHSAIQVLNDDAYVAQFCEKKTRAFLAITYLLKAHDLVLRKSKAPIDNAKCHLESGAPGGILLKGHNGHGILKGHNGHSCPISPGA